MDLMFLKYNFKSEMQKNTYSWQEIFFALNNKIINTDDVVEYAIYVLNEGILGFDTVLELTYLSDNENVYSYLDTLIQLEEKQDLESIKAKWLYLILKWLYNIQSEITNILEIVEEIYEQFDYPSNIVSFVRYMPSEAGDLGSPKLNRERMFKNWKNYLESHEEEL